MTDLSLRCSCGSLRGVARDVSGARGNRLVCYCDDCQSFAHFLGRADEILDPHGGTDIFQMSPGRIEITAGAEHLACVRLKEGGLHRWYASCCKSPIGNSPNSIPFVGLIHTACDHASDGRSRDETLGPIRERVNARFAQGDLSQLEASDRASLGMIVRFLRIIVVGRLRGEHRPSPFFDEKGKPKVKPRVLTGDELSDIEAARDAA